MSKHQSKQLLIYFITFIFLFFSLLLLSCSPNIDNAANDIAQSDETELNKNDQNLLSESEINGVDLESSKSIEALRIGIYAGQGSWDVNVKTISNFMEEYGFESELLDESDLALPNLSELYDQLWFPGGGAADYKYNVPDHDIIRSFVEEGGSYVGICAGAYYAAEIFTWMGEDYKYPLQLFKGTAAGPLGGELYWGSTAYFQLTPDHPANKNFPDQLEMYYFDGPAFYPANNINPEVIARYSNSDQPAVIADRYGDGKYLLLGPHPEIGGYSSSSPDFDLHGSGGAQWPWLSSLLDWFNCW